MDDRRLFLAVAEHGSFAAAARQLAVSRSTVLRRVDTLEQRLGLVLLHRAGRQIALTDAGQRYAQALRPLMTALTRVEEDLRHQEGSLQGKLRLWLPVLGTTAVIAPLMAQFRQAHPAVELEIELAEAASLRVGDFDLALQVGLRRNAAFRARVLYRERLILVASPQYLDSAGEVTLARLGEHRSIRMRDVRGRLEPWRAPDGTRVPAAPAVVSVNAVGFAHQLALLGQGIARLPRTLAAPQLRSGALVQVLPELWVEEPVSLVFPGTPGPLAAAFVEHAVRFAAQEWGSVPAAPAR